MKLALIFGALAPKLREQLRDANMKYERADTELWQRDADEITRLSIRGLLSDSVTRETRHKLLKQILAGVEPRK